MRAAAAAAHSHTVAGNSPLLTHEMRYTFAINAICFQIGHSCSNGIFLIKIIPHCVGCVLHFWSCHKLLQEERGGSKISLTKCFCYVILQSHDKLSAIQFERMWMDGMTCCYELRICLGVPQRNGKFFEFLLRNAWKSIVCFNFLKECKRIQPYRRKSISCRLKYAKELAVIA